VIFKMAAPMFKKYFQNLGDLSLENVCFRYIPLAGGASCLAFSVNILNSADFNRVFGDNNLVAANSLWLNSHLGVGLYLYSRKHIKRAPLPKRILFSVFGSAMFNFAVVLMWASAKQVVLPDKPAIKTLFGLVSGATMLAIGREYLKYVDCQAGNMLNEE
ncbi:unnamed protein product, partial [Owenia fusiformis]